MVNPVPASQPTPQDRGVGDRRRGVLRMMSVPPAAFEARLLDLLSTLEVDVLLGAAGERIRGLGEHLRFACLAMQCDEALVALEVESLGRLTVPVVATAEGFRTTDVAFLPAGTPFAYLLAGGGGHAAELGPNDPMIRAFAAALRSEPRHGVFVPIAGSENIVGGAAFFTKRKPASADLRLDMAERLSHVLALTVESFRTERVVFELFARALPDILQDVPTSFSKSLGRYVAALRLTPMYRRRLALAGAVARVAERGEAEAELVVDLLDRVDRYARTLVGLPPEDEASAQAGVDSEEAL